MVDIVAEDVEPGLVDVWRAAAGEREHELGTSAAARQDETTPLFRMDVGVAFLERVQCLGGGILRMRRPVTHEERYVRRSSGLTEKDSDHERHSHDR